MGIASPYGSVSLRSSRFLAKVRREDLSNLRLFQSSIQKHNEKTEVCQSFLATELQVLGRQPGRARDSFVASELQVAAEPLLSSFALAS